MIPFNEMSKKMISVAHLVLGLSELEPISIDDEGSRDKCIREDSFPLKDPAMLRMRLVLDSLLLDMMIVRRESRLSLLFPRQTLQHKSYIHSAYETQRNLFDKN